MNSFILITGGARSGKSSLAEKIAQGMGGRVIYIATAIPFDDGMKDRIKKHRMVRPDDWWTIENYRDFHLLEQDDNFQQGDTVLLDCITLMVSNLLLESDMDFEDCLPEEIDKREALIFEEIEKLLSVMMSNIKNLILVTNEVGMGLVPSYKLGNIFRDIAGRVNQYLASKADEVYLTVSGIPLKIK